MNTVERKKQQDKKAHKSLVNACVKACKSFSTSLPMLLGIILLMGLFQTFISPTMIAAVFSGEMIRDMCIGTLIGSISAGNPITSYIIGGELLDKGVSLFAVAAFIVAWVTVGIVQYPAEMDFLGKRFATLRNILSSILAILVSIATVTIAKVIQ
jgi:uncharacterized membrane protein YraQ (UPF0718 family)